MTDPQTPATCPGCADWLNNATPHINHDPQTPATEAGRRLHGAIWLDGGAEPMRSYLDWDESASAILAIEAEARAAEQQRTEYDYDRGRADALREAAEAVGRLPWAQNSVHLDAVLAILDPQP